jgi:hypothetical protein
MEYAGIYIMFGVIALGVGTVAVLDWLSRRHDDAGRRARK